MTNDEWEERCSVQSAECEVSGVRFLPNYDLRTANYEIFF